MPKWEKTRTAGIYLVDGTYHLKKRYLGVPISGSTGIAQGRGRLADAESILERRMTDIREMKLLGVRQKVPFRRAAAEYCLQHQHLHQIESYIAMCERLDDYVGDVPIEKLHQRHPDVQQLVADLRAGTPRWGNGRGHQNVERPRKKKTVWAYLEMIGRVLRFCANDWRDDDNVPFLTSTPRFSIDDIPDDRRRPHALTWDQQRTLLKCLAPHQARMFLLAVNTGLRDREICQLRWSWIRRIENVGVVAVVPAMWFDAEAGHDVPVTKGGKYDRVVPMNSICQSVLEECQDDDDEFVFVYRQQRILRMTNTAWKRARMAAHQVDASIPEDFRVHDMRHTFGHRLEAAGVDKHTRQTLLGHRSGDITDHYSQDDLLHLVRCVERITKESPAVPVLSLSSR